MERFDDTTGLNVGNFQAARMRGASETAAAPVERLNANAFRPKERFDAWAAAVSNVVEVAPLDNETRRSGTSFTAWRLDNLVLSEATYCPHTVNRRPGGATAAALNFVRLFVVVCGRSNLILGDEIRFTEEGDVNIVDYSRSYREVANEAQILSAVFLPHDAIGFDPSRHPPHIRLSLEAPEARMIADALASLRADPSRIAR